MAANTRKKAVLQVFRSVDSSIATVARIVSKGAKAAGLDSNALVLGDGDQSILADDFCSVNSLGLPAKCWKGLRLRLFFKLLNYIREQQPDVLIGHRYKEFIMLMLIQRLVGGFKLLVVIHGERDFNSRLRRYWFKCLMNGQCSLVAVSVSVKDYVRAHLPEMDEGQITVINNGVDFDDIENNLLTKQAARMQLSLPQDKYIFGSMGRLAQTKGTDILIKAFAQLPNENNAPLLALMGEGDGKERLAELAKALGVQSRVMFLGKVANGAHYLSAFDCFVFPSRREGFGLALVEAIAAKLPVVFSDIKVFKSIVKNRCYMVVVDDVNELSDKMQACSVEPLERQRGTVGEQYDYAKAKYSVAHSAQGYTDLLIGLAHRSADVRLYK